MTNAIQKFCIARSVKLHAEQEESKHRDEVFRVMQLRKKPVVVRAEGRTFLVSLDREKFLSVVEAEDLSQEVAHQKEEPCTKPAKKPQTTAVKVGSSKRIGRAIASCSKQFLAACSQSAKDEGWNMGQWADSVIPEAYLHYVEGGELCDDPGAGNAQITAMLSAEVLGQVQEIAKALGGRRFSSSALRRLIAYSLPNGGTP